jgi:hypothetical protein
MPHFPRPTALVALALLVALGGCEVNKDLPLGGSITLSPTQPVHNPVDSSNAEACIVRNERGRPSLTSRERCAGDDDGVIRGR